MKKYIEIHEDNALDTFIEFLRSPSGHVVIVAIMATMTSALSIALFGEAISTVYQLGMWGYVLGFCFAMGMEFGIFFLSVNGYRYESFATALMSIIILSATFIQVEHKGAAFEIARWVMCIFPPLMIALVSDKLSQKYRHKIIANTREHTEPKHEHGSIPLTNQMGFNLEPLLNGTRINGTNIHEKKKTR